MPYNDVHAKIPTFVSVPLLLLFKQSYFSDSRCRLSTYRVIDMYNTYMCADDEFLTDVDDKTLDQGDHYLLLAKLSRYGFICCDVDKRLLLQQVTESYSVVVSMTLNI